MPGRTVQARLFISIFRCIGFSLRSPRCARFAQASWAPTKSIRLQAYPEKRSPAGRLLRRKFLLWERWFHRDEGAASRLSRSDDRSYIQDQPCRWRTGYRLLPHSANKLALPQKVRTSSGAPTGIVRFVRGSGRRFVSGFAGRSPRRRTWRGWGIWFWGRPRTRSGVRGSLLPVAL